MKAKYRDYQRKVLEFLVTKTDDGTTLVSKLREYGRIPKSSMTNVLSDMEQTGLVEIKKWFNKQKKVWITAEGRKQYLDILAKPGQYAIPFAVKYYLGHREPKVSQLFPIQNDFVDRGLLLSNDNICTFAYPGTGKTLLAEMAMVETITNGGRALYCTPYKALDWQKYGEFGKSFSHLGEVAVTDGDNPVRLHDLAGAKVIIGTYERVAGALRRNERWLSGINLVCADEITLLADDHRGSTIDLLLTLLKRAKPDLRIITLSSIIGNPLTISRWLSAKPIIENATLPKITIEESVVYKSGDQLVFLYRDGREKRDATSEEIVTHLVRNNVGNDKTTLIFVGPRKDTTNLAERLKAVHGQSEELTKLVQEFERAPFFEKTNLTTRACELLRFGIAFHHAGLHKRVRRFIEKLLSEGKLRTIVATGTLSHGVDFKIDSVIIDLASLESVHVLHRYEYINYKGRAGRPGKSESASVYIVCDESDANNSFSRYYLDSPEAILPRTVFRQETLMTIALSAAASKGSTDSKELTDVAKDTLSAEHLKGKELQFGKLLSWLEKFHFLVEKGQNYHLTELGRKVNESNISPLDALEILKLGRHHSTKDLVSLASRIDLVRNLRTTGARRKDPTEMLLDWMEEMPIDSIKTKYNSYWDDGDIILFGEYTAIALDKILTFLDSKSIRNASEFVEERLRYGVKEDIVKAGLTRLSLVTKNKARFLARALRTRGYKNLKQLGRENPSRLAQKLAITESEATSIIGDCRNLLKKN